MSKAENIAGTTPKNSGYGIFTDDKNPKLITNFLVNVKSCVDMHRIPEAKSTVYVKLEQCLEDGDKVEFMVSVSELNKVNWLDGDFRFVLYPDVAPAKAQRYIANNIREKLPHADKEKQYRITCLGFYIVEGEPVFCTGGEVIRPPHDGSGVRLIIEPEGIPYTLDIDPNLTEETAIAEMFELISLFPDIGRILLAYNLLYFMRELYATAWKSPRFCINPCGPTDSRKTTISAFFCQAYNRRKGIANPPRMDSSIPSLVDVLYSKSDAVEIFDDLCPSDVKDVQRFQEKSFSQIVRIIGDGVKPGRKNMMNPDEEKLPPTSGVVLPGEYPFGAGSDLPRFLTIEVTPPSDKTLQQLSVFQKEKPLVVSTLYRNFIQWFISNYDWAKGFLAEWWDAYSQSNFKAFGMEVHGRLRETHYFLNTAYVMFLEYCSEKGCISEDEAQSLHHSFFNLLTGLVQAQQARMEQSKLNNSPNVKVDYLAFIRKRYHDGVFKLAPSVKEFGVAVHDGVIHMGRLYIYGESFRKIIKEANANLSDVLDDLDARGALVHGDNDKTNKTNKTIQLFVSTKEKRRCYAIFLSHLK